MKIDGQPAGPHAMVQFQISQIAPPDIAGDVGRAIASYFPVLSSFVYLYDRDQANTSARRLEHVLTLLNSRIETLAATGVAARDDSDFHELVLRMLPTVARTRSEEKRERFANILSNAATRTAEADDEAITMGLLVDQLEAGHIVLLDRIVRAGGERDQDDQAGDILAVPIESTGYTPTVESHLWGRLHSLGLLAGADGIGMAKKVQFSGTPGSPYLSAVFVTTLGLRFHSWITDPSSTRDNA